MDAELNNVKISNKTQMLQLPRGQVHTTKATQRLDSFRLFCNPFPTVISRNISLSPSLREKGHHQTAIYRGLRRSFVKSVSHSQLHTDLTKHSFGNWASSALIYKKKDQYQPPNQIRGFRKDDVDVHSLFLCSLRELYGDSRSGLRWVLQQ